MFAGEINRKPDKSFFFFSILVAYGNILFDTGVLKNKMDQI